MGMQDEAASVVAPIIQAAHGEKAVWEKSLQQARAAVAALTIAGWTLRPPCTECDARYQCRMAYDDGDLGDCAIAVMEGV